MGGERSAEELPEGWYLMSTSELERELRRRRGDDLPPTNAPHLSIEDALAYRDAGNLSDATGRTLRLILHVDSPQALEDLNRRRLEFEPDFHEAPRWRREGSAPVNVVPLRRPGVRGPRLQPWWEEPDLAAMEEQWMKTGTVGGVTVPGEYRSFAYKTALALRAAGKTISVESLADSIARWVPPDEAEVIRRALRAANAG